MDLFFDVAPGTPLSLIGDPLRLSQVLNNLVGNAVKFTDRGEIHLHVEPVERDERQALLRFTVRDTGIGLSEEQLARLFRPFMQADGSTTRRYGGTGLGLTICRHLVEMMDGEIVASGAPGEGCTFTFTARLGLGEERRNLTERHHLQGLKVLVVDDQETSRQILRTMIEFWSGRSVALTSGERVIDEIERAEAEGSPYELVLLDWQMPGLDGVEVARLIERASAAGRVRRTPMVIMVTAFSKDHVLEKAGSVHLDGFLTKPVTPSSLFNAVRGVRDPSLTLPVDDVHLVDVTPYGTLRPILGAQILVVEDNTINQEVAREFLEKAGLRVSLANNGREGVEAVRGGDFDAVLMDMQMPEMDGLEATRIIRTLPEGRLLPIIAMTAAAMPRDKLACAEAGMNDHIAKPIVPKELLDTLLKWVRPRASIDAPPSRSVATGSQFPEFPGVDGRQASARLAGNRALFIFLLEQMAEKFANTPAELRSVISAGDRDDALRLLHSLRGVAGNVSANHVASLASEAEAAIRDARFGRLPALLDQLDGALRSLFSAIRIRLGGGGSDSIAGSIPPVVPLDPQAVAALVRALREHDAVALDQYQALRSAFAAGHGHAFAGRLGSAIEGLRFAEAMEMLHGIGGSP